MEFNIFIKEIYVNLKNLIAIAFNATLPEKLKMIRMI